MSAIPPPRSPPSYTPPDGKTQSSFSSSALHLLRHARLAHACTRAPFGAHTCRAHHTPNLFHVLLARLLQPPCSTSCPPQRPLSRLCVIAVIWVLELRLELGLPRQRLQHVHQLLRAVRGALLRHKNLIISAALLRVRLVLEANGRLALAVTRDDVEGVQLRVRNLRLLGSAAGQAAAISCWRELFSRAMAANGQTHRCTPSSRQLRQ